MNYQVGDLFCATWDEKDLYIITNTKQPEKDKYLQDVYFVTCMKTFKNHVYRKESIDALFRKVS